MLPAAAGSWTVCAVMGYCPHEYVFTFPKLLRVGVKVMARTASVACPLLLLMFYQQWLVQGASHTNATGSGPMVFATSVGTRASCSKFLHEHIPACVCVRNDARQLSMQPGLHTTLRLGPSTSACSNAGCHAPARLIECGPQSKLFVLNTRCRAVPLCVTSLGRARQCTLQWRRDSTLCAWCQFDITA